MDVTLTELEQAINYWRALRPSSGEEHRLSPEVDALATVYGLMIYQRVRSIPFHTLTPTVQRLLEAWRQRAA